MSKRWLIILSLLAHGVVLAIALVINAWRIDRLGFDGPPSQALVASLSTYEPAGGGSPAATPATPAAAKPKDPVRKHKPPVLTQLEVARNDTPVDNTPWSITGNGSGNGSGSGSGSGEGPGPGSGSGGDLCPPGADCVAEKQPPKPDPKPELLVAPPVLKGLRISGETQIAPPEVVQTAIRRDGKSRVVASVRVCIGTAGEISSAAIAGSTHYPEYDQKLIETVQTWRYRPYVIGGQPAPVCSMVTFIYAIE